MPETLTRTRPARRVARRRPASATAPHGSAQQDARPAAAFPLSRWYVVPLAHGIARLLKDTPVRPSQVTVLGLAMAGGAAAALVSGGGGWVPAALVALAWLCDRVDGPLARLQHTASAWGAWLDANVDELTDLGLHVAVAAAAARGSSSTLPWLLLVAFLLGKYLLMYGLHFEDEARRRFGSSPASPRAAPARPRTWKSWLRNLLARAWHVPGNADVRVHLLVAALAAGQLTLELAAVAVYYNLRWSGRYLLVARRLGGER